MFSLILEGEGEGEGKERGRGRWGEDWGGGDIDQLPPTCYLLETEPVTQACALTGN